MCLSNLLTYPVAGHGSDSEPERPVGPSSGRGGMGGRAPRGVGVGNGYGPCRRSEIKLLTSEAIAQVVMKLFL